MRATFTDEQQALAETARDLASTGLAGARSMLDGGPVPDEPTAALFGGFGGLGVPEDAGGLGGGLVELALLLHELGRTVTPTPFVAHALAVQVALGAGLDVSHAADGQTRWALAVAEGHEAGWGPWATSLDGETLAGTKVGVADGATCDAAVITVGSDGVALATPSERTQRPSFDPSRPAADLSFEEPATASTASGAAAGLRRATAGLAAELAGVARGAVDLAVGYASERQQFGQPIGRFQGVAHQIAEAYVGVESAWSLALYAAWAVDADAPDASLAVHTAKSKAGDAAVQAAECCTQVHGGIGITWEADPHLYLRRALAASAWLGGSNWHRRRVGSELARSA